MTEPPRLKLPLSTTEMETIEGQWASLFTPAAIEVLSCAIHEVERSPVYCLGTEHILLGLLNYGGAVSQFLYDRGLPLSSVRKAVEYVEIKRVEQHASALFGLTPTAKGVIQLVAHICHNYGHAQVEPVHLLQALLQKGESSALGILTVFAVNPLNLHEYTTSMFSLLREPGNTPSSTVH